MTEFERTLKRLAEITEALIQIPAQDFAARDALLRERDVARDRLAELRDDIDPDTPRSTDELRRELAALEQSADALRRLKIDPVKQAGGGSRSGEMGNLGVVGINLQIAEATGLTAIEQRIQRLRGLLEDRNDE